MKVLQHVTVMQVSHWVYGTDTLWCSMIPIITKYNGINIDKGTRTIQKGVYISIIYSSELCVTVSKEPERIM
jgi:hypothetical protein